uniref:Uncharacterized protein n=1 Tax=Romanomermis culicivorax TaxID=13658 RepID=A0A915IVL2_ROMCU
MIFYLAYAFSHKAGQNSLITELRHVFKALLKQGKRSSMKTSIHVPKRQKRQFMRPHESQNSPDYIIKIAFVICPSHEMSGISYPLFGNLSVGKSEKP